MVSLPDIAEQILPYFSQPCNDLQGTQNTALRTNATKSSRQIASIPNGVQVDTVSDELVWDPDSQRHFVQVSYDGKTGWIASSILGMRR